ncbi:FAD-dependent oxidoreductase [Streptomyces sp. NPDC047130]|uniref:FAD-dependent oxidoreductase n=1 Tax=Streptomyces sp. NPDC047130 TaxID=3155261 RepID=UPI0033CCF9E1
MRRRPTSTDPGGFTGLWTALEILRRAPGTDIVLLGADIRGGGASGADADYLMPMWARFSSLLALGGPEEARRIGEASAQAVDDILALADEHGIDIEYRRATWAALIRDFLTSVVEAPGRVQG